MSEQTSGKKLFVTYAGDHINGPTRYVHFFFLLPTNLKGDITILKNYAQELKVQMNNKPIDVGIQCSLSDVALQKVVDKPVDDVVEATANLNVSDSGLGRTMASVASPTASNTPNVSISIEPVYSPARDGFDSSDGEYEAIMIEYALNQSFRNSTPLEEINSASNSTVSSLTRILDESTDDQPPTPPQKPTLATIGRQAAVDYTDAPGDLALNLPAVQPSPINSDSSESFEEIPELE